MMWGKNAVAAGAVVGLMACGGAAARAQATTDPLGDFLPTYTGPQNGDVDVLFSDVTFTGSGFLFQATLNGTVGTTAGSLFVWGLDRGQGTERFVTGTPSVGAGVLFDSVVVLRPDTTVSVNRLNAGGGGTNLPAGSAVISGPTNNMIRAFVGLSDLPSLGLQPSQYTWNLWPRVGVGSNSQISDFAPNATGNPATSNAVVSSAPEPATLALLTLGGLAGLSARRRRRTALRAN